MDTKKAPNRRETPGQSLGQSGQLVATPPDLLRREPADVHRLADVRVTLEEWLTAARVDGEDAQLLQHALGELITNAIDRLGAQ